MGTHQSDFDLPPSMSRAIGRIMTRWSYIEYILQNTIYALCRLEPEVGRLAVREPRIQDRLDLILDLAAYRKLTIPQLEIEWKTLRDALVDSEDFRNVVAHSVWFWSPEHNAWAAHVARGSWPNRPKSDRVSRNKRMSPEGQIFRQSAFSDVVVGLERIIKILQGMKKNLEAQLQSSPQIRP